MKSGRRTPLTQANRTNVSPSYSSNEVSHGTIGRKCISLTNGRNCTNVAAGLFEAGLISFGNENTGSGTRPRWKTKGLHAPLERKVLTLLKTRVEPGWRYRSTPSSSWDRRCREREKQCLSSLRLISTRFSQWPVAGAYTVRKTHRPTRRESRRWR